MSRLLLLTDDYFTGDCLEVVGKYREIAVTSSSGLTPSAAATTTESTWPGARALAVLLGVEQNEECTSGAALSEVDGAT